MACKPCKARRLRLQREQAKKREEGKALQAAALGAVLAVTQAAGKALGMDDEQRDKSEVGEAGRSGEGTESGAERSGEDRDVL